MQYCAADRAGTRVRLQYRLAKLEATIESHRAHEAADPRVEAARCADSLEQLQRLGMIARKYQETPRTRQQIKEDQKRLAEISALRDIAAMDRAAAGPAFAANRKKARAKARAFLTAVLGKLSVPKLHP